MRINRLVTIVLSAFLGIALAASGVAQNESEQEYLERRKEEDRRIHASLDPLLRASERKMKEAREFMKVGELAKAEASAQAALSACDGAEFLKAAPRLLLAQIYLMQGAMNDAYFLYDAQFKHYKNLEAACGLTLSLVGLGRVREAAETLGQVSDWVMLHYATYEDMPIAKGVTAASVEATALLMWVGAPQSIHPLPEQDYHIPLERLRRAAKLAPDNAPLLYNLADWMLAARKPFDLAEPILRKAHAKGNPEIRRIVEHRFRGANRQFHPA